MRRVVRCPSSLVVLQVQVCMPPLNSLSTKVDNLETSLCNRFRLRDKKTLYFATISMLATRKIACERLRNVPAEEEQEYHLHHFVVTDGGTTYSKRRQLFEVWLSPRQRPR